jgi:hypothetical protein
MLVVATAQELAEAAGRVWGTGGWEAPEQREARDWLCLGRLCGWPVMVAGDVAAPATHFVVWTGSPPDERATLGLVARLEHEPLLIVAPAAGDGQPWARAAGSRLAGDPFAGHDLQSEARAWRCREPVCAVELAGEDSQPAATLDGRVIARLRRIGRGAILTLGFHPSAARDADGAFSALLRTLLVSHARASVTALDWSGTLVLRMDDPGSPESAYHAGWRYPKLGSGDWRRLGAELRRRRGRMSAAYVPAFVDDGDPERGRLEVIGRPVARHAGALHPSRQVRYRTADLVWDGVDEHTGLAEQLAAGVIDIELHGHTHLHPDRLAWAAAPDRYDAGRWYRELVGDADAFAGADHPLARGLDEIKAAFGISSRALVCPGDAWTESALVRALDLGVELVSSYYLALRDADRFVWCQHVCAPYLDTAHPRWFAAELPVVGYFHDMEPSVHGLDWLTEQLDAWTAAGARRLISLGDLAAALAPVRPVALDCRERGDQ